MREIRTSGLMRAKVMAMPGLRYSTVKYLGKKSVLHTIRTLPRQVV